MPFDESCASTHIVQADRSSVRFWPCSKFNTDCLHFRWTLSLMSNLGWVSVRPCSSNSGVQISLDARGLLMCNSLIACPNGPSHCSYNTNLLLDVHLHVNIRWMTKSPPPRPSHFSLHTNHHFTFKITSRYPKIAPKSVLQTDVIVSLTSRLVVASGVQNKKSCRGGQGSGP